MFEVADVVVEELQVEEVEVLQHVEVENGRERRDDGRV